MNLSHSLRLPVIFLLIVVLSVGCSSSRVVNKTTNPVPKQQKPVNHNLPLRGTQKPYYINNKRYYPLPSAHGYRETGLASWYGPDFHGKKTSNGELYNMHADTAAHKTLPMGTVLLVNNLDNGKQATVRINDRGPFVKNRIIDLSYKTAKDLNLIGKGTAKVEIIALGEKTKQSRRNEQKHIQSFKKVPDFNRGKFYVQIGAYTNQLNAENLARTFLRKGRNVAIQQFFTPHKTFYRVQVFAGTSLKSAYLYQHKLAASQFPDAFVIAR